MKKVVRTSLNNVANKRGVRDLNIQLYSHDKNNAGFEFEIKNEVDLSEYKAKVLFDFQESFATWETKGTIEGNVVKVKFDTTFITRCEEVIGYLFLDSETNTLDVFKFKFNVVLSEIDKYDIAKRGFRYIKDQEVVDVITRSELEEEIKKLQVNGGIDLSNYLTTSVASEIYAKKTDLPAPYNDSPLNERVTALENRPTTGGSVDTTNLVTKAELKEKEDDIYDAIHRNPLYEVYTEGTLTEHLNNGLSYASMNVDSRGGIIYSNSSLTKTDIFKGDINKEKFIDFNTAMFTLANSIPDNYSVFDLINPGEEDNKVIFLSNKNFAEVVPKEELKAIIREVGGTGSTIDASHFITEEILESKGFLTTHQDISNLVTKKELEKAVTKEELEEKHYVTNEQISSTYATKSEIPQPYSDTELVKRITVLENKQDNDTVYDDAELKRRVTALEEKPSVDTSNFVTREELESYVRKVELPEPYNDSTLISKINTLEQTKADYSVMEQEFNSKFVTKDDLRTLVTEIVNQLKSENN